MRTFKIGPHIWFVLHEDAKDELVALEEHDWREGGCLSLPVPPETWATMFVRKAVERAFGIEYQKTVQAAAIAFLTSGEKEVVV